MHVQKARTPRRRITVLLAALCTACTACAVEVFAPPEQIRGLGMAHGATALDHRRERHRRELRAHAAQMTPRHAKNALEDPRRRLRPTVRQRQEHAAPPIWPGIIADSSRWLDKSSEERNSLRQQDRARQGLGAPPPRTAPSHPLP